MTWPPSGPVAIPVYAPGEVEPRPSGSAFLVRHNGAIGLFTAAHVPVKAQPFATPNWEGWPPTLGFVLPDAVQTVTVPIFLDLGPTRMPLFKHVRDPDTGRLADMMGLFGSAFTQTAEFLGRHYPVFNLGGDSWSLSPDTPINSYGYPGTNAQGLWPPTETTTTGVFHGPQELMFEATMATEEGCSGGPVTKTDGWLVGMVIGKTSDGSRARIVPRFMLEQLLAR